MAIVIHSLYGYAICVDFFFQFEPQKSGRAINLQAAIIFFSPLLLFINNLKDQQLKALKKVFILPSPSQIIHGQMGCVKGNHFIKNIFWPFVNTGFCWNILLYCHNIIIISFPAHVPPGPPMIWFNLCSNEDITFRSLFRYRGSRVNFRSKKIRSEPKNEQVLTSYTSFLSLTFSYYLYLIGQIWREIQKTKKVGPEKAQK